MSNAYPKCMMRTGGDEKRGKNLKEKAYDVGCCWLRSWLCVRRRGKIKNKINTPYIITFSIFKRTISIKETGGPVAFFVRIPDDPLRLPQDALKDIHLKVQRMICYCSIVNCKHTHDSETYFSQTRILISGVLNVDFRIGGECAL